MTISKRVFGYPASLKDMMTASKEFTDAAMSIDIDHVLYESREKRKIGRTAAHLSGVKLQLEGDSDSKRIIFAAYDTLYDLMQPSLVTHGSDTTQKLFTTDTTRATLLDLSTSISSYGVSTVAYKYRSRGDYLHMTESGLELNESSMGIPKRFESNRNGCPYAKTKDAPYFNQFADHIVETYAQAHRQDMPHGWLDATSRWLIKR
ncbi:MAG: hypothetical protein JWM00_316 [Candidatus Saccharibacteria bacterium]|nr:hypothetical protein [Candidatus Saccharibacteria bacterium]